MLLKGVKINVIVKNLSNMRMAAHFVEPRSPSEARQVSVVRSSFLFFIPKCGVLCLLRVCLTEATTPEHVSDFYKTTDLGFCLLLDEILCCLTARTRASPLWRCQFSYCLSCTAVLIWVYDCAESCVGVRNNHCTDELRTNSVRTNTVRLS